MKKELSCCNRCGSAAVHDATTRSVRCPKGCFRISVPEGKDEFAVWNSIQKSIKGERVQVWPRKLSHKERQDKFDRQIEAEHLRRHARLEAAAHNLDYADWGGNVYDSALNGGY